MEYFETITSDTNLEQNTGSNLVLPPHFEVMSARIISKCTFSQNLIQQIIYTSHGPEIVEAKKKLKEFPNPKARFDFLCEFPYHDDDPVVVRVFDFARSIFRNLYAFRNILAHEVWSSSDQYPGAILFSSLDENSRLLMAQGRLWHDGATTPQEIYDAAVRFIRKVKVVTTDKLEMAISDADICAWSLMNIHNILNTECATSKEDARNALLKFKGTSHLFEQNGSLPEVIQFQSSKEKNIKN